MGGLMVYRGHVKQGVVVLDDPVKLPEGTCVEVAVLPDLPNAATPGPNAPPYDFWHGPTIEELAAAQGVRPIESIEQLRSAELQDAFEGFDETLEQWRREPWRREPSPGEDK